MREPPPDGRSASRGSRARRRHQEHYARRPRSVRDSMESLR
ncbi:MAG: hypothetical protein AVDCRST_MAG42-225 [uncultured Chthoniobacterales bacterium]|uniref:Uncharacterized protein n=1 Tax=uncultured Chthoniobacterales bacterium TaxID=1836801 RepID=A0A6J4H3Z8_9BACT|nr:MAG: hypothetical protein AVDCRST_MAG42-225 [uncultured Chthoniobacterales bacterium]